MADLVFSDPMTMSHEDPGLSSTSPASISNDVKMKTDEYESERRPRNETVRGMRGHVGVYATEHSELFI